MKMQEVLITTPGTGTVTKVLNLFSESLEHSAMQWNVGIADVSELDTDVANMVFLPGRAPVLIITGMDKASIPVCREIENLESGKFAKQLPENLTVYLIRNRYGQTASMRSIACFHALNVLLDMKPSDFCGCDDGDMNETYPDGIFKFLDLLSKSINKG
jgi:hypothetical protein